MTRSSPLSLLKNNANPISHDRVVRIGTTIIWKEDCRTKQAASSFTIAAARLWNKAPANIKEASTLNEAKRALKDFCKSLTISLFTI